MPPSSQTRVYYLIDEQNHCHEYYPVEHWMMELVSSMGKEFHDHLQQEHTFAQVDVA
jgi:hypothetical protein